MSLKKELIPLKSILRICFVCLITLTVYYLVVNKRNDVKDNAIKSDMLLIQGSCKVLYEESVMKKEEDKLVGTKLSEANDKEEINKDTIENFKKTKAIEESEYEKYYILTDENLTGLNLEVKNAENSYYLINYETQEVIITAGYNGKYKLSDIEKENSNKQEANNEGNEEKTQEEAKDENKEGEQSAESEQQEGE